MVPLKRRVGLAHVLTFLALVAPASLVATVALGANLYATEKALAREKAKPREVYAKAWPEKWGPGDALNATKNLRGLTVSRPLKNGMRETCQQFISADGKAQVYVCYLDAAPPPPPLGRPVPVS